MVRVNGVQWIGLEGREKIDVSKLHYDGRQEIQSFNDDHCILCYTCIEDLLPSGDSTKKDQPPLKVAAVDS